MDERLKAIVSRRVLGYQSVLQHEIQRLEELEKLSSPARKEGIARKLKTLRERQRVLSRSIEVQPKKHNGHRKAAIGSVKRAADK